MNEANETAPLHRALWDGDLPRVRQLLDDGADPNARDPRGWTPLSRAIERRQPQIALLLIERGADCRATDKRQRTPLHWASQYGTDAVAEKLLEQGADVEASDSYGKISMEQASRHGRTAIVRMLLRQSKMSKMNKGWQWTKSFFLAIRNRHPDTVAAFLDEGQSVDSTTHHYDVSFGTWHPSSALMEAIAARDPRTIALLLHRGADIGKKFGRYSVLTNALIHYGKESALVQTLLDRGATIGLEEAIVTNNLVLAEHLLADGLDREMPDDHGQTLVTWAAQHRKSNAVRLLVRFGANPNPKPLGIYRIGPLASTAATGDIALMEFLVAHGATPDADCSPGQWTPLQSAASSGQIDAMRWLIDRFGMTAEQGGEALISATASNRLEAVRFLLDAGVDANARNMQHEPSSAYYGRTALMYAAWRGSIELVRLLLDRGADARYTDGRGIPVLSYANQVGRKRVVPLLISQMIAQGMLQKQKNNALMGTIRRSDMAALLLKDGADPNAITHYDDQYTLLTWAAKYGETSLVRLLIDHGAKTDAVDKDGKTALDYAEQAGRADIAALLRQHAPLPTSAAP